MQVQTLFDIAPKEVLTRRQIAIRENRRKQREVFAHQSSEWKKAVLEFAENEYLPNHQDSFLAENLREAYDAYARFLGLPQTIESRAFNGIMSALLKKGLIRTLPPQRREINGVWATAYIRV